MQGSAQQIDNRMVQGAGGLSFMNAVDSHLRVISELQLATQAHHVIRLRLKLFYDNEPAGILSFDLNGYSPAEAVSVARNIGANQYIMREIDEYLCGDMVE
ncbi:hypothetical protein [Marinobacterium litorale]|jgi:hypothetical protein|uniref:hypothetical protein n=1 Tax=Marinobacterium litorale TaxID=404770 RepID=UPI0004226435|nr:hypothetical protein [Marinobacterium litorale]